MTNRLRVLRAERRWSQAHLADLVGVSRQTINAIETGRHDPSLSLAFRLARVFGRPLEETFDPPPDVRSGDARSPAPRGRPTEAARVGDGRGAS